MTEAHLTTRERLQELIDMDRPGSLVLRPCPGRPARARVEVVAYCDCCTLPPSVDRALATKATHPSVVPSAMLATRTRQRALSTTVIATSVLRSEIDHDHDHHRRPVTAMMMMMQRIWTPSPLSHGHGSER